MVSVFEDDIGLIEDFIRDNYSPAIAWGDFKPWMRWYRENKLLGYIKKDKEIQGVALVRFVHSTEQALSEPYFNDPFAQICWIELVIAPEPDVLARLVDLLLVVWGPRDMIGPPWLAHVASFEAVEAVNGIFDPKYQPKKVTTFPGCTYCQPQVASIGLTEAAAKEKKLKFKVGRFPYRASGRAVASGDSEGLVKILIGEPHGEILGAHIIGAEATELIAEVGLGMTLEATADEIAHTIHAHPTLTEMIKEATEAAVGHAIHI